METERLIIDDVRETDKEDYFNNIYWGRGCATEAVRRFLDYLLNEKGYGTVCASFFTGNDASRRVMEKCGMKYDRFSEKELTYLGVKRDLTYYSVSRK